jgi:hypothetical protein
MGGGRIGRMKALCSFCAASVRSPVRAGIVACGVLLWIAGCAHQPQPDGIGLPGFWSGLFHGFLIVFSFIASLFTHVRIYNFPNNGRWYDFGFLIGAAIFLGGSGSKA